MKSYWMDNSEITNYPKIEKNIITDVCIIGAGITGMATAYMLTKNGFSVTLLDKDKVCMGVTANTTAKITSQHDLFYKYLADTFSKGFAKNYLQANEDAIHTIAKIIEENNIDCDFERQDSYVYTNKKEEVYKFKEEIEVLHSLGFNAEYIEKSPLPFNILAGIKFSNQAQFNPRKYVLALANIVTKNKRKNI